jgi:hypothetical protein
LDFIEQVLDGVKAHGPAFDDILFGLGFELLPFSLPEPSLVAIHDFLGDKDNGVIDDF